MGLLQTRHKPSEDPNAPWRQNQDELRGDVDAARFREMTQGSMDYYCVKSPELTLAETIDTLGGVIPETVANDVIDTTLDDASSDQVLS